MTQPPGIIIPLLELFFLPGLVSQVNDVAHGPLVRLCTICVSVGAVDLNAVRPPFVKGNSRYSQWLEGFLRKAQAKLTDPEMTRTVFTIKQYLQVRVFTAKYTLPYP